MMRTLIDRPTSDNLVWGTRQQSLSPRFRARVAVIESLIARWTSPTQTAIDVSGGAGRWLPTLAPRFRQFWHMDFSRAALVAAKAENPSLTHVQYGFLDLMTGQSEPEKLASYDVLFCLDTLLYDGKFIETALTNFQSLMGPDSVAIIEFPSKLRWKISRAIKGTRYRGPSRAFSQTELMELLKQHGYECLELAFQYSELPPAIHRTLSRLKLTRVAPLPSTWAYVVIRPNPVIPRAK